MHDLHVFLRKLVGLVALQRLLHILYQCEASQSHREPNRTRWLRLNVTQKWCLSVQRECFIWGREGGGCNKEEGDKSLMVYTKISKCLWHKINFSLQIFSLLFFFMHDGWQIILSISSLISGFVQSRFIWNRFTTHVSYFDESLSWSAQLERLCENHATFVIVK